MYFLHSSPSPLPSLYLRPFHPLVPSSSPFLPPPPSSPPPSPLQGPRRASDTIIDWKVLDTGQSGDELSSYEDCEKDDINFEQKKLYLLVARCIAYPFNAKFQIENTPPRAKLSVERFSLMAQVLRLTLDDYDKVVPEFRTHLSKQEHNLVKTRAFLDSLRWMLEVIFCHPQVIAKCNEGEFSVKELETIFSVKAISVLTEEGGGGEVSSSDTSLWCTTFRKIVERCSRAFLTEYSPAIHRKSDATAGSSTAPNKDQLYKLFQKILKIRSMEHQILYRECQVGGVTASVLPLDKFV